MANVRTRGDLMKSLRRAAMTADTQPRRVFPPPDPAVVGPEVAGAPPVVVPEHVVIRPDPSSLPPELIGPDGQPALPAIVAYLWAAVQEKAAARTRVAVGRATLATGQLRAGESVELQVVFDSPALAVPESGWVQQQPATAWLGRTRAVVLDDSITTSGCTVRVTALATVNPSAQNPITYEAVCIYSYTAPFTEES